MPFQQGVNFIVTTVCEENGLSYNCVRQWNRQHWRSENMSTTAYSMFDEETCQEKTTEIQIL